MAPIAVRGGWWRHVYDRISARDGLARTDREIERMNGLNSIGAGGATTAAGPSSADSGNFDEAFMEASVSTGAVLMQFIGADILESVMKDEQAVD